jgi:hypothetical protein
MMNSLNRDQRQKLIDAIKERAKKIMTDTITNLTSTIPPSLFELDRMAKMSPADRNKSLVAIIDDAIK